MPDVSAEPPVAASPAAGVVLAAHTTLRLGGPAGTSTVASEPELAVAAVRAAAAADRPVLILAGGSNVVVADDGFPGTVVLLRTRGVAVVSHDADHVVVRVAAGEPWDDLVARTVAEGWSGVECLAGVPGSTGATPIQNVGAYGQEVAQTIVAVRAYDRLADTVVTLGPAECGFGYRTSVFKHSDRWLVLDVDFRLSRSASSTPIRYAELARQLGVAVGDRVPLDRARDTVLKLRAGKGMVLDPDDRDTWSVGSFFTNPVLSAAGWATLRDRAGAARTAPVAEPGPGADAGPPLGPPHWPGPDGSVKVPAAWLIEHAGIARGYGRNGVAISSKHTLALTNRGGGTTAALLDLAREVRARVSDAFGVVLEPEPVLVNCRL